MNNVSAKDTLQYFYEEEIMPLLQSPQEDLSDSDLSKIEDFKKMHMVVYNVYLTDDTIRDSKCQKVYQEELEQAKEYINNFCIGEFGIEGNEENEGADFSDLSCVDVGFTTTEDNNANIQIAVDLTHNSFLYYLDDERVMSENYSCLKSFNELNLNCLGGMDNGFDNHVGEVQSIYDKMIEKGETKVTPNDKKIEFSDEYREKLNDEKELLLKIYSEYEKANKTDIDELIKNSSFSMVDSSFPRVYHIDPPTDIPYDVLTKRVPDIIIKWNDKHGTDYVSAQEAVERPKTEESEMWLHLYGIFREDGSCVNVGVDINGNTPSDLDNSVLLDISDYEREAITEVFTEYIKEQARNDPDNSNFIGFEFDEMEHDEYEP